MGHLRDNGFEVEIHEVEELVLLNRVKADNGIRDEFSSCHTAFVGDYVIEGHVPADVIRRLLQEKPDILGLTVPGMPIGSPGMEGPNPVPYDVLSFDEAGETTVYERR